MVINNSGGIMARLTITNILWVALLIASWNQGWLQYLFVKDVTFISHAIAFASALVVGLSLWKGHIISKLLKEPDAVKESYSNAVMKVGQERRADIREGIKTEFMSYISFIEYWATSALAIGVLGTVIGLILGFQNVDPALLSNVENAGSTVAEVLKGLSVAFHTTLVGGIANLWLRTNHHLLMQGQAQVYARIMEG